MYETATNSALLQRRQVGHHNIFTLKTFDRDGKRVETHQRDGSLHDTGGLRGRVEDGVLEQGRGRRVRHREVVGFKGREDDIVCWE